MIALDEWWSTWAPFWEHLENKHLGVREIESVLPGLRGPVLVVGAGQGLIVERLRSKGLRADGVDLAKEMVAAARERRSLDLIRADGLALPFKDRSYQTVVIATGVVDYIEDDEIAAGIIKEAGRILAPLGTLVAAFYQLNPTVERVYRKMGVVDSRGYHMDRIFKILGLLRKNPLKCVKPLTEWTGMSYPIAFLYWTKLGLTLPAELKREQKSVEAAVEAASKRGIPAEELFGSTPGLVPYRKATQADALLKKAGFPICRFEPTDECVLAVGRSLPSRKPERGSVGDREVAISADGLTKTYESSAVPAVSDLSLRIRKGSVHGFLGPNGAGKTTTLSMLTGLIKPTGGTVTYLNGIGARDLKRQLGYVPQELAVYDSLSGRDNLKFFGRLYGLRGAALNGRMDELLTLVGLENRAGDRVSTYSTGMKRRLNLAAGLLHEPKILFLDEPTVGVDPQSRNAIFEMIRRQNSAGATILYTTHYMDEASKLCDTISIMDAGKVILEGNPKELVAEFGLYTFEVEAPRQATGLAAELEKIECIRAVETGDGRWLIRADGSSAELEVVERLRDVFNGFGQSMSLRGMTGPDLESLFLDLTGKGLRDGPDATRG